MTRPKSIDNLIEEYGVFLGIEDLSFDSENLLSFDFSGTELTLQYQSEKIGILLKALVAIPGDKITTGFLTTLHGVNYASASHGMGTVLLDRDFGAWVWIDRFDPRGMTSSTLHEKLNMAAENIAFWAREIPEMLARFEDETSYQFAPQDQPFIRA